PSVPVMQQAHGTSPSPRLRPLLRREAPRAPDPPARRGPGIENARLPVADRQRGRRPDRVCPLGRVEVAGRPRDRRTDRAGRRRGGRQDRAGCRGRLPAGTGPARAAGRPAVISGIVTAVLLVMFIGGWIWAWSPARRTEFDAAAQLPLEEDA